VEINIKVIPIACLALPVVLLMALSAFAHNKSINNQLAIEAGSPSPIDLPNVLVPFDYIVTGGQPTFDQMKKASEAGFKTVINLRTDAEQPSPAEESSWVEELGMKYVHIPVAGAKGLTLKNTKAFASALLNTEDYPLIIHCKSGNRVGALFSLKAFYIDQKSKIESIKIGKKAGLTSLESAVQEMLQR